MKRYLPEKAWDLLNAEEQEQAEKKKAQGDQRGKQFVENTLAAKAARAYVDHGDASELTREQLLKLNKQELVQLAQKHDITGRSSMRKVTLAKSLIEHFRNAPPHLTREELYEEAKDRDIDGRSTMDKSELIHAVQDARSDAS